VCTNVCDIMWQCACVCVCNRVCVRVRVWMCAGACVFSPVNVYVWNTCEMYDASTSFACEAMNFACVAAKG
jgi:hypothetical protein